MSYLGRFVLPADVIVAPVGELDGNIREQVKYEPGDFYVTRPLTRTVSSIVDAKTARLLECFRKPATIVDVAIAFSLAEGLDARTTLGDMHSVLGAFINEGLLVAADSELSRPIATSLRAGDRVGEFKVVKPVHLVDDTEVYLAHSSDGSAVALKIARAAAQPWVRAAFANEATVLTHLDSRVSPRLIEAGEFDGRPFLAISWCASVDLYEAATQARELDRPVGRAELLKLAERLIEAYAHLHAQGVLHADVHPRNVLVDANGGITIVDYGFAVAHGALNDPASTVRGGIDFYLEPEVAKARLASRPMPAPTAAGEQYSIGTLLYLLLTGTHTHSFSLERKEMLHQVLEQSPTPFHRHGTTDLPTVELTVDRALAKKPSARHRSVAHLLRSFRVAAARDHGKPGPATGMVWQRLEPARQLLDDVVARLAVDGDLFTRGLPPPTASAMNGAAGLAYALLRIAGRRGDAAVLSLADLWSTRAVFELDTKDAFWNAETGIVADNIGRNSFYHHAAGVRCVQALLAHAHGDDTTQQLAVDAFTKACEQECDYLDVGFGRAGLLLGCATLLDVMPPTCDPGPLRALGERLRDSLWSELAEQPTLAEGTKLKMLGAAHGWAGLLYSLLRWSEASATAAPAGLHLRLEQLGALGRPAGRGLYWPVETDTTTADTSLAASWCHGTAGYVHLWTLAHTQLSDERFAQWATMAAWTTSDPALGTTRDLCCGLAGRAYALLRLYQHTGETTWLARARAMTHRAVTIDHPQQPAFANSLYKGDVGLALLAADLEAPDYACMPLFQGEGWPRRSSQSSQWSPQPDQGATTGEAPT